MRCSRHGGSCVLIKNGLRFKGLDDINKMSIINIIECSAVELIDHKIYIVCIYRPPNKLVGSINSFFLILSKVLSKLCIKSKKIIICGDFNIDITNNSKISIEFVELLLSFNIALQFNQVTRSASNTCIDNIAHNIRGCKCVIRDFALSDHTAQIMKCPVKKCSPIEYWYVYKRSFTKENRCIFAKYLSQISYHSVYESTEPDSAYNSFHDIFSLIYDLCFPIKKIRINNISRPKWLSKGIRMCSKRKRELLWKYRKNSNSDNKMKFKAYAKKYKTIISLTKMSQNNYFINTAVNKSKATWKVINDAKYNYPNEGIEKLIINDEVLTDPKTMANAFNDYFADIVKNTDNNFYSDSTRSYSSNLTFNTKSIFMPPTIPPDILNIITSLRNTNSAGYDGITTKIVKDVATLIAAPLSYIINLCIEHGIFPEKLKLSVVKPAYKKDDKSSISNYRPIALVTIFSKIFERNIYNCLYRFFEDNNIFTPCQYGFRKNKSVNIAMYNFLHKVVLNMDTRSPAIALYMDMSKAFDRVSHKILLNKLYASGVRGNVYKLIESYLSDRKQMVELKRVSLTTRTEETVVSEVRNIVTGVPQGSILGPPFFLIYINDMSTVTKHHMTLFADDSTILFTGNDRTDLNLDLNNTLTTIIKWLHENDLKMNLGKTKIMDFKQRVQPDTSLNICYSQTSIEEIEVTKFLGLYIDSKLNWKSHIEQVCKRLSQSSYALYRLRNTVSQPALLTAYHGYVASIIRYGIIFWGNSVEKERAFRAQKRCIRSMCNIHQMDSCRPHFINLKILTLPSVYIYETVMFIKSNPNLFEFCTRARHKDKLRTVASKTKLLHQSIFCMGPRIFNNLPPFLRTMSDINTFKKKLHELLISKCYYSIGEFLNDNTLKQPVYYNKLVPTHTQS